MKMERDRHVVGRIVLGAEKIGAVNTCLGYRVSQRDCRVVEPPAGIQYRVTSSALLGPARFLLGPEGERGIVTRLWLLMKENRNKMDAVRLQVVSCRVATSTKASTSCAPGFHP